MSPLLPEYLPKAVQIVVESPSSDWWSIAATVFGAALGAGVGGWVAYKGTLKANRSLVNQSKLEECLTLVDQMRNDYESALRDLGVISEAHGLSSAEANAIAKDVIGKSELDGMVSLARQIHTLVKLHAHPIFRQAERLVLMSVNSRSLFAYIDNCLDAGDPYNVADWCGQSLEYAKWVNEYSNQMERYLVEKAKT